MALGKTVGELEDELGSGEFSEWKAYYNIEPFGQERDNWNAAQIASTVANCSGRTKKTMQIHDFMFAHPDVKRARETKQTLSMIKALAKRV